MNRRIIGFAVVLVALGASCGQGAGAGALTREVAAHLDATRAASRTFRYVDETLDGDHEITVQGKIQDDLRYAGTVSLNDKDIYEQIVSDDSVAVRLIDRTVTKPALEAARRADPVTAQALEAGAWVVDHTVAPPLLAAAAALEEEGEQTADAPSAGRRRTNLIGDEPFTDSAQVLNYTERAVRSGFQVERFNREDIDYNPLDDPWRGDTEAELEDRGVRRYDLRLPPLPRPAERGQQQRLPTVEHFRKMALYARGERIVEIREQISIRDRREFRRAEAGRSADFYLRIRDAALAGALQDQIRERRMRYVVTEFGEFTVTLPEKYQTGILRNVLSELKKIYDFEYIGGDTPAPIVGPGGSPLPIPTVPATSPDASPSPGASPATSPAG